ncbi:rab-GTPase-TBC domain-containing protein [Protomyces lactucae-debilis]|uniref:Rab-GTPase-TBC domain-containing protein n=1 Tax=Protomyces lactucae-debilis TaxID=2754530 RepID=A0A1Y2FPE0_PROLT|nr:rab-GTPase-TBC domain-containing protein [Protomyces lactucae-debilis]ORY85467.1 rab-GTPase-TBC domain-containing protein [Protomyces lactucae-debilis]
MQTPDDIEERDGDNDTSVLSYSTNRVTLVWVKSAVYAHPTPRAKDNICGYLSLSRRPSPTTRDASASDLLLSWTPADDLHDELDEYQKMELDSSCNIRVRTPNIHGNAYAFSVTIQEIATIQVRPPRTGWSHGSIQVTLVSNTPLTGLFFHDNECVSTLQEQKQRATTFDPFGESGHMFWGFDSLLTILQALTSIKKSDTSASTYVLNPSLPPMPAARRDKGPTLQWKILERFSRITRLGRSTADQILESEAGKDLLARLPPQFRQMVASPQAQNLAREYDSARLYLARWAASISDASQFSPPSAASELFQEETSLGMFEVLSLSDVSRREPVTEEEWRALFNERGEFIRSEHEIKELLFHGACVESIMGEVWSFLLGVFPWDSDTEIRRALAASKRDEYYKLKRQWFDQLDNPTPEFVEERHRIEKDIHRTDRQHPLFENEDMPSPDPTAEWGTNAHMEQLKDILLTYNEYNKDLGYVQGMADLLSPVYVVSEDDGLSFWAFVGLMDRMQRNFLRDQSGMRLQLTQLTEITHFMLPRLYAHLEKCESLNFFFFFRMLLILFKREFEFDTILKIWTCLLTNYYSPDFQIFCALAILDLHAEVMMTHLHAFDEILKYVNDLSGRMKADEILARAEKLYLAFQAKARELEKRQKTEMEKVKKQQAKKGAKRDDAAVEEVMKKYELSDNLAKLLGKQ